MSRTVVKNIRQLIGILDASENRLKKGKEMDEVQHIDDAYLLIEDDKIVDYGPMPSCPQGDVEIDAGGRLVMPTWVDSHTHIVFAKPREEEFVMKIKGATYAEIAAKGGGILNSAKALRDMGENALYERAARRVREVIGFGTGALEIKSGYGLSFEGELKMLRVIKRLQENFELPIKATFLGAHAFPTDMSRSEYMDMLIKDLLPVIASEGLADYMDVFCEQGFFSLEETDRLLQAGNKFGLKPKIHANQLSNSGAIQVAIKNGALSVDHLEEMGDAEIAALLESDTIPVGLPSCSYFINIPYAPLRRMIDAGLGVVIASDYNPGSTPSGKVPFLLSLACTKMRLTPNEAFNAVTINAAHALELESTLGSITRGKQANFLITKEVPSLAYIPYAFGSDHVDRVFIAGKEQLFTH